VQTLKFGTRAKQIKNKAKVNKEFSNKELKILLERAEKELKLKNKKIETLEEVIQNLNEKLQAVDPEFVAAAQRRLAEEQAKIDALLAKKAMIANTETEVDKPVDNNSDEESDDEVLTVQDSNYEPI
jgi:DNA-directed RNA polymerase subunit K/omega